MSIPRRAVPLLVVEIAIAAALAAMALAPAMKPDVNLSQAAWEEDVPGNIGKARNNRPGVLAR